MRPHHLIKLPESWRRARHDWQQVVFLWCILAPCRVLSQVDTPSSHTLISLVCHVTVTAYLKLFKYGLWDMEYLSQHVRNSCLLCFIDLIFYILYLTIINFDVSFLASLTLKLTSSKLNNVNKSLIEEWGVCGLMLSMKFPELFFLWF